MCAGAASIIVTYPMENLRTHVSLGRKGGYSGILSDIYREHVRWLCVLLIRCMAMLCLLAVRRPHVQRPRDMV